MSQSSVQGSVTLRKLRTGATATISLSSTMQLFQLYTTKENGQIDYVPDWSGSNTHPTVSVNVAVSQGSKISVQSVVWKINGTQADTIQGITIDPVSHSLEINTNLAQASILNFNSGTLTAEVAFTDDSGHVQIVTKSEIIRVQKSVPNGYNVMINTNRAWVDANNAQPNTQLTAVCYQGASLVTSGVRFDWFKGANLFRANNDSIPVSPDDVDGSQLFTARAYINGNEVDAESILIVDNSDPFYIVASAQQSKDNSMIGIPLQENVTSVNVAAGNDATTITFKVKKASGVDYSSVSSWVVEKMHADTMKLIEQVNPTHTKDTETADSYNHQTASAVSISMDVFDADYVSIGNGSVDEHDTEVIVTATATL